MDRGFSLAGTWLDRYQAATKKKGLRKDLKRLQAAAKKGKKDLKRKTAKQGVWC
jgi:hypothetical protein